MQTVDWMERLGPFGCGNPEPIFVAKGISLTQILPTKNPAHVRLMLRSGESKTVEESPFRARRAFGGGGGRQHGGSALRVTVEEYRGARSLKLQVRDYSLS